MSVEISDQAIVEWGGYGFQWVLTADGRKAVRASEVVQALGKPEKDTARLLMQNVFPDFRFQSSFGQASRPAWYLYEHGAIQLATLIKTPEAEAFQRWVFDVVVKIFASGYYIAPTATSEQLAALQEQVISLQAQNGVLKEQRIYKQFATCFVGNCIEYRKGRDVLSGEWRRLLHSFWKPFIARFPEHACMPQPSDQEVTFMMYEIFKSSSLPKNQRVYFASGGCGDLVNAKLSYNPDRLPTNFMDCLKIGDFGSSYVMTAGYHVGE